MKSNSVRFTACLLSVILCYSANATPTGPGIQFSHCGSHGFKVHRATSFVAEPPGTNTSNHRLLVGLITKSGPSTNDTIHYTQNSLGLKEAVYRSWTNSSLGSFISDTNEFPEEVCDCSGWHAQNSVTPDWPKGLEKPKFLRGTGDRHPAFVANRNDTVEKQAEAMAEHLATYEHQEVRLDDGRGTTLVELYPHDGVVPGDEVSSE